MLTLCGNAILGCCGYGPLTISAVHSAVVYGTEEEVDQFLEQGKEQNLLLKGIQGVMWKVQTGDSWLASYTIPLYYPNIEKFLDKSKTKYVEQTLKYTVTSPGHIDYWNIEGGTFEKTSFAEWLTKNNRMAGSPELNIVPISGFGANPHVYKEKFTYALRQKPTSVFGVVFTNTSDQWVQEELENLRGKYKILVDVPWHNPRYVEKTHDLHTMFFTGR